MYFFTLFGGILTISYINYIVIICVSDYKKVYCYFSIYTRINSYSLVFFYAQEKYWGNQKTTATRIHFISKKSLYSESLA